LHLDFLQNKPMTFAQLFVFSLFTLLLQSEAWSFTRHDSLDSIDARHKQLMRSAKKERDSWSESESIVIDPQGVDTDSFESDSFSVEYEPPASFMQVSTEDLVAVCGLAEWTPWSKCSKACGGGRQTRIREAKGLVGSYFLVDEASAALLQDASTASLVRTDLHINDDAGDFITVLAKEEQDESRTHYSINWAGQLLIEKAGRYKFNVDSNGASSLSVGAALQLSSQNGGRTAGKVWLAKGAHQINLQVSGKVGSQTMNLQYSGPDTNNEPREVSSEVLRHWSTDPLCKNMLHEGRECNVEPCF
jgi:hypothetical protein